MAFGKKTLSEQRILTRGISPLFFGVGGWSHPSSSPSPFPYPCSSACTCCFKWCHKCSCLIMKHVTVFLTCCYTCRRFLVHAANNWAQCMNFEYAELMIIGHKSLFMLGTCMHTRVIQCLFLVATLAPAYNACAIKWTFQSGLCYTPKVFNQKILLFFLSYSIFSF